MKTFTKKNQTISDIMTWFLMILYPATIMVVVFLSLV
jgi:hypothetical protein